MNARLPTEVYEAVWEDALECARRTRRYKFGRLSNRRIVGLLRAKAAEAGLQLTHSDAELIDLWFAVYEGALKTVS
jgi:hypothetical protein